MTAAVLLLAAFAGSLAAATLAGGIDAQAAPYPLAVLLMLIRG